MAQLKEYAFSPLLDENGQVVRDGLTEKVYRIPFQQRAYKWTPVQAKQLLEDLKEFVTNGKTDDRYCMQPLAVCPGLQNGEWEVLDGQQRLTTLLILNRLLKEWTGEENAPYRLVYDRNSNEQSADDARNKILYEGDCNSRDVSLAEQDLYNMSLVRNAMRAWLEKNETYKNDIESLFESGGKELLFLWYEVSQEEAHLTFRTLNSGKIALTNADLIKALLLSDTTKEIKDKALVAAQFSQIEQELADNHFWYAICPDDSDDEHPRIDLLFNIVAGVSPLKYWEHYDSNKRSFDWFYEHKAELENLWQQVRDRFVRLKDLASDTEGYHYMGMLTYVSASEARKSLRGMQKHKRKVWAVEFCLNEYRKRGLPSAVECMRQEIKNTLKLKKSEMWFDNKVTLRRAFVLHNIETILQRYRTLQSHSHGVYQSAYQSFPFELLYTQDWDIEHIASHTDNPLENKKDQADWIEVSSKDYPSIFDDTNVQKKIDTYKSECDAKEQKKLFAQLYTSVIKLIEKKMKEEGFVPIPEEEKNRIKNLVLLDSHTNRSYHNSLMPRKRRIILKASDQGDDDEKVQVAYIPPCTLKVFIKGYNSGIKVSSIEWNNEDAATYESDIDNKLAYYYIEEDNGTGTSK